MPIELHGFMQDEKWGEDLGHIVLGYLPIDLLWWLREWTTVRLPWPFKGQWPPGDRLTLSPDARRPGVYYESRRAHAPEGYARWTDAIRLLPENRVSDSARDELGRSIGAQLRVLTLGALLWWKW